MQDKAEFLTAVANVQQSLGAGSGFSRAGSVRSIGAEAAVSRSAAAAARAEAAAADGIIEE